MSNSFRIEILGQRDASSAVTVDRSLPSPLAQIYSSSEWATFCDKINKALEPFEALKKKVLRMTMLSMGFGFGMFAIAAATIGISFGTGRGGFNIFPLFIVLGLLMVFVPAAVGCYTAKMAMEQSNIIKADLQRVVNEESERRYEVSFHLREEVYTTFEYHSGTEHRSGGYRPVQRSLYYIECVINNTVSAATVPLGAEVVETSYATPVAPSAFDTLAAETGASAGYGQKSAVERLQELEAVKGMLSENEYNQKRSAILATL